MARAEANGRTVTTKVIDGVQLTLSLEEAEVLAVILAKVGGSPEGRRGIADGIQAALYGADIKWNHVSWFHLDQDTLERTGAVGSITLK